MKTQRDNIIPKGQPVPGTAMNYNGTSLPDAIAENNNSANSYIKNAIDNSFSNPFNSSNELEIPAFLRKNKGLGR